MRLIVFIAFLLPHLNLLAQVRFVATTGAREVVTNGVFDVTYRLENAKATSFRPPTFENFRVVAGPSKSTSTRIVNGNMSSATSWTYTLLGTQQGEFTIGSGVVQVDGKTLRTNNLKIKVVKGKPQQQGQNQNRLPTDEEVYLVAELDTSRAYPGQQIHLHYRIFTAVNIRNYNALSEDKYDNFFFRYVKNFDDRPQTVVIDGIQYTTRILKTVALFPQQTGQYKIEPLIVNAGIGIRDKRSTSFFFNTRTIPKRLVSNPVTLDVIPLPEDPTEAFSGAVGRYRIQASISRNKISTDDALELNMRVSGDGDMRRWSPPVLDLGADFEVYEPKVASEKSVDQNGTLMHTKVINYLIIPRTTGSKVIRAGFTYFDVDSSAYRTLQTRPLRFAVVEGRLNTDAGRLMTEVQPDPQEEILPMKAISRLRKPRPSFFLSPLYYACLSLPLLFLAVNLFLRRRQLQFERLDPAERKRRKAQKIALGHLSEAKEFLDGGDTRNYYDAISRTMFGYISDKLNISTADLTKHNITERMQALSISPEKMAEVMETINRCEQVLYAGAGSAADDARFYDKTLNLITDLEGFLGA